MFILGISAFYHDSAACLIHDGDIIAAAQEERFTRIKHDSAFPNNAIKYCLKEAKINPNKIENIVFYEKPFLKFERLLETYLAFAPKGFVSFAKAIPVWVKDKLFQKSVITKELKSLFGKEVNLSERLLFSEHHLSHAASAFYPSPFEKAAILTLDGVGEWTTTSLALGKGKEIKVIKEIKFPHSLGLLYSAFTYYTGFKVNSGEYKVMGLAPYGEPRYVNLIKDNLVNIADDGSFQLDMSYFNYATGLTMTNKKFDELFGGTPRKSETNLTQREMDLASSIQKVTEEIIIKLAKDIAKETGEKNLCLAGGVALNCVANGILMREKIFDNIWIQPAAGDAGGSLGAALALWYIDQENSRIINPEDSMKGSYLGKEYSQQEIEKELITAGAKFDTFDYEDLIDKTTDYLMNEKAIGWFQGRMEFGPRALGGRSILGDPRSDSMQKSLNLKVKYRESFRPFAPSILKEDLSDWFNIEVESPYMLIVADIKSEKKIQMTEDQKKLFGIDKLNIKRSTVPAVTHVDYSARIQTVTKNKNQRYFDLLSKFKEKTGCPILINTSFNVRGEPIVNSPTDAFNCFMGTELDYLIIGNCILNKLDQNPTLKKDYTKEFALD